MTNETYSFQLLSIGAPQAVLRANFPQDFIESVLDGGKKDAWLTYPKAGMISRYMTRPRFHHRVEAFSTMQEDLDKEKDAIVKQ